MFLFSFWIISAYNARQLRYLVQRTLDCKLNDSKTRHFTLFEDPHARHASSLERTYHLRNTGCSLFRRAQKAKFLPSSLLKKKIKIVYHLWRVFFWTLAWHASHGDLLVRSAHSGRLRNVMSKLAKPAISCAKVPNPPQKLEDGNDCFSGQTLLATNGYLLLSATANVCGNTCEGFTTV